MLVVSERNVNGAYRKLLPELNQHGIRRPSRNGDVIEYPTPVMTCYERPTERVLFASARDEDPFFHLFEALWMLAGRRDVAYPTKFVKRMKQFSDDGITFWGAYGHRWRNWFGSDQLLNAIERLRDNPDDRRIVISMWDGYNDPKRVIDGGRDVPCNTQAYLYRRGDRVDLTVCCRSNDVMWGLLGANAVHMSVMHEYVTTAAGLKMGSMRTLSNSLHAYCDFGPWTRAVQVGLANSWDMYSNREPMQVEPHALMSVERKRWDMELFLFLEDPFADGFEDPFFAHVAKPLMAARVAADKKAPHEYVEDLINRCAASDWRQAAFRWEQRRHEKGAGAHE